MGWSLSCLLPRRVDASKFAPQRHPLQHSPMTGRLIAVGDIHGCHVEFAEMLELLELKGGDRLVLLGDLVNRGPDSVKVIDLARAAESDLPSGQPRAEAPQVPQDRRQPKYMKERDLETFDALRPEDWAYLEAMPLTYEEAELNTVFVHGGFLPGEPWQKQPAEVVTRIQVVDKDGQAQEARRRAGRADAGRTSGAGRPSSSTATRRGPRSTSSSGPSASTRAAFRAGT